MRILNLYAGIGGNRKLWGDEHEVTAVEIDPRVAKIYQEFFPNDRVVVGDAHEYLKNHFREYDFIWSSPPCQTHSRARYWGYSREDPVYPDMRLWQEIIFLQYHADNLWVVENVVPYYTPLIRPTAYVGKHAFWANFHIPEMRGLPSYYDEIHNDTLYGEKLYGFDLSRFNISWDLRKRLIRNAVDPRIGLHVLKHAELRVQSTLADYESGAAEVVP